MWTKEMCSHRVVDDVGLMGCASLGGASLGRHGGVDLVRMAHVR